MHLSGELRSALCAAAGKDLAAVLRCHSLAETMLLGALALLRLIRSKHIGTSLTIGVILNIGARLSAYRSS